MNHSATPATTRTSSTRSRVPTVLTIFTAVSPIDVERDLSRWYLIDWSHTARSPHGSAVTSHVAAALTPAMTTNLRERSHHAIGMTNGKTSGLIAIAAPNAIPVSTASRVLLSSRPTSAAQSAAQASATAGPSLVIA